MRPKSGFLFLRLGLLQALVLSGGFGVAACASSKNAALAPEDGARVDAEGRAPHEEQSSKNAFEAEEKLGPVRAVCNGPSCQDAQERWRAESGRKSESSAHAVGRYNAILGNGFCLNGCGVRPTSAVEVCAFIVGVRAVGVTVSVDAGTNEQAQCVANAVRAMEFPDDSEPVVAVTRFPAKTGTVTSLTPPRQKTAQPRTDGDSARLDVELLRARLFRAAADSKKCLQDEASAALLKILVAPSGKLAGVEFVEDSLADDDERSCVLDAFRQVRLPPF